MTIETHRSVDAYFFEQVGSAIREVGVEASQMAAWYMVQLLAGNLRPQARPDEPLALQYVRTLQAPAPEKVRQLQELGDTALYVSGFFGESLAGSLVEPDYYASIGSAAYGEAVTLLRTIAHGPALAEVLEELAENFTRFMDVLAQVSEASVGSSGDVLKMYERWLRTRSQRLESRLRAQGMILPKGRPD